MIDKPQNQPVPATVEAVIGGSCCKVRDGIRHRYHQCENHIRKSPIASVLGAVCIGYLLHRLPVRAILVTKVRVLTALAPPVLFLYGAIKVIAILQNPPPDTASSTEHSALPRDNT